MKGFYIRSIRIGSWVPCILYFILGTPQTGGPVVEYDSGIKSFWEAMNPYLVHREERALRKLVKRHDGRLLAEFIALLDRTMPEAPYSNPRLDIKAAIARALAS